MNSVDLAIERVHLRVLGGGHNIPVDTIRRRYQLGIENLFNRYISVVDYWLVFDNSSNPSTLIAEGDIENENEIYNESTWTQLKTIGYGQKN